MIYKGIYTNGYVGCDDILYFRSDNFDKVNTYMQAGLYDYLESYEHVAIGYSFDNGWEDEESMNDYYDCGDYTIEEVDENEDLEYEEVIEI